MDQDLMRKQVKHLHVNQGISYMFIARKVGISPSYLSRWINDERIFSDQRCQATQDFINKYLMEE